MYVLFECFSNYVVLGTVVKGKNWQKREASFRSVHLTANKRRYVLWDANFWIAAFQYF